MAKPVKLAKGREFQFKSGRGGALSKYDWDAWFNGDLLLLEQSTGDKDNLGNVVSVDKKADYDVSTNTMPGKLKFAARKRYKVVQISRVDADGNNLENSIIVRARDMNADEKMEENRKRAEEKAAREAKKAEEALADAA